MNRYAKFGGASRRYFSICEKPMGGHICAPPAVRWYKAHSTRGHQPSRHMQQNPLLSHSNRCRTVSTLRLARTASTHSSGGQQTIPRPGGGLSHLRHGGGGGPKCPPPPLTRKLGKLEGRAIRRSTALSEPVRRHFGHFFAQVNIEVSRGHQRSNF